MHPDKIADIIVVLGSIIGSTLIASNIGWNKVGYAAFILSSIATFYLLGRNRPMTSLKLITIYFLVVNIVGFIRY